MGFFKKALFLTTGVPVRPTTKRERFQYKMADEAEYQSQQARYQSQLMEQSLLAAEAELQRSEEIKQRIAQATAASVEAKSAPSPEESDPLARLEQLADLHSAGALTDEEYEDLKAATIKELGG